MPPVAHGEIAADQGIEIVEQVQVERRGDPEGIVVGGLQDGFGFDQVHADQKAAAWALLPYPGEERERFRRREVSDRRPGIEEQAVVAANRIGQAQSQRKVAADTEHFQVRKITLERGQRMPQEVHGHVHGDILARLERLKQAARFLAVSRSEVDQCRLGSRRAHHAVAARLQQRPFRAGRIVLRQFGDGLEQARAERPVEILGRHRRRLCHQSGHDHGRFRTGRKRIGGKGEKCRAGSERHGFRSGSTRINCRIHSQ